MVLNYFANIKKLFLLGIAVASTKVMLLLFAYFFNAETYNQFNQIYYTASIVILFGSLGFNIAITRINISIKLVAGSVFLTTALAYVFLQIFSAPFENIFEIISILVYCLFISLSGIYVFQLLFTGRYQDYIFLTLLYSALHLLIIPAILFLHLSLFSVLPVVALLWFLTGFRKYIRHSNTSLKNLSEFYKIGISAFVINSAVSLALAADKYFVNHFFSLEIANSYTFAWGLTAPMFYIGVLIEQYLFSETNASRTNILKRGFILVISLVLLYAFVIIGVINFFPKVIPVSVDYDSVLKIFTLMIIGYSLYVIMHFPVNVYLFKSLSTEKQKTISKAFAIIISGFLVLYILIFQGVILIDYIWLLTITWSYIFTLFIVKIIIMFNKRKDQEVENTLIGINNLEP
jgi:hypothetical protein